MNDKLKAAHDKLQNAVAEIASGDDWKRMLKVASNFHRYSFNNHQMEPLSIGRFALRSRAGWLPAGDCVPRPRPSLDVVLED
jgi:hypothetical protein